MHVKLSTNHSFCPNDIQILKSILYRNDVTWTELTNEPMPPVVPTYDKATDTVTIDHPYAY